jgi:hypothetical protein
VTAIAPRAADGRVSVGHDARDVATTVLVGAAAGALAGLVVGGLAGRLVMLALRFLSDPIVIGATSDDGFEIGRFTLGGSFQLAGAMAAAGAANGILYVVLRDAIPARARAPLWSLFAAAVGGSQFVHSDGIDFTLLDPLWLAVLSFVALPGLAALVVVLLAERWLADDSSRPPLAVLAVAALTGTVALVLGAVAAAAVLGARRLGLAGHLAVVGRLVLPAALVLGTVLGAWVTIDEASQILG